MARHYVTTDVKIMYCTLGVSTVMWMQWMELTSKVHRGGGGYWVLVTVAGVTTVVASNFQRVLVKHWLGIWCYVAVMLDGLKSLNISGQMLSPKMV